MRYSRSFLLKALLAGLALTVGLPGAGSAQTAQMCLSSQNRSGGTAGRGAARCYAKAIKKGEAVDAACLSDREAWLGSRYNSAEAANNCLVEPASATVWSSIDPLFLGFANDVMMSGGACSSKKMGALGRAFKQLLNCYAVAAELSQPSPELECLDKAETKVDTLFSRYEDRYACLTTGDASTLASDAATAADTIGTYLLGSGTTTTSTTTSTSMPPDACLENGAFDPCYAYRDNPACKACVDATVGPDAGVASTLCGGAGPACDDAVKNAGCG